MRAEKMSCRTKCNHDKLEFLGDQKGDKGINKYFRCQKCGSILIFSEDHVLYEVSQKKG
jgi:ribosomal protein S26